MGKQIIEVKVPSNYNEEVLSNEIYKSIKTKEFEYSILKKSLDGRNFRNIHWIMRIEVSSNSIQKNDTNELESLEIDYQKRIKRLLVVGSGPAGLFAALTALKAGFDVEIIEMGPEVNQRIADIKKFEKTQELNEHSNYAYGEGGAGTFSDGKLTSRTKTIEKERRYIFNEMVKFGAPEEIVYLSKPHVGSNLLVKVLKNMRKEILSLGGIFHFDNKMIDFNLKSNSKVYEVITEKGNFNCDYLMIASGHSSYDTYKLLISKGVGFDIKPFAIGSRVEHLQENINMALWKQPTIAGVKSADYALTFNSDIASVYSFCMCPGGMVVSAPPKKGVSLVNGMSNYKRNYPFANSAIVVALNLNDFLKRKVAPVEALDWVNNLEKKFFDYTGSYNTPSVKVSDFLNNKISSTFPESSFPFELITANYYDLFPKYIVDSMKEALVKFSQKMKGFDDGVLIGLESRTSSPIQAKRSDGGLLDGFENLYFVGEGSGYSGGIISSAADGIKAVMNIIAKEN